MHRARKHSNKQIVWQCYLPTGLEGIARETQHALLQRPCSLSRVCLKALIPIQSQKQLNSLYHPSCREKNSPPTSDLFRVHISTSKCTKLYLRDRVPSIIMFPLHLQTFPVAWGVLFPIPSVLISCLFWLFRLLYLLESNCPGAVNVSVNTCFGWVDLSVLGDQMIQQGSQWLLQSVPLLKAAYSVILLWGPVLTRTEGRFLHQGTTLCILPSAKALDAAVQTWL